MKSLHGERTLQFSVRRRAADALSDHVIARYKAVHALLRGNPSQNYGASPDITRERARLISTQAGRYSIFPL